LVLPVFVGSNQFKYEVQFEPVQTGFLRFFCGFSPVF
jgi:hypothetical protein